MVRQGQPQLQQPRATVAGNTKLKTWWNALKAPQQTSWLLRWQQLDPKRRCELTQYVETTIAAQELVEDDIDRFVPYDVWRRGKKFGGPQPHGDPVAERLEGHH